MQEKETEGTNYLHTLRQKKKYIFAVTNKSSKVDAYEHKSTWVFGDILNRFGSIQRCNLSCLASALVYLLMT